MPEENFAQGFRVEVTIRAPRDIVWRALTDPEEIARWFGWDYADLGAEIQMIFVDGVTQQPPERLFLGWEQTIELESAGPDVTIVRIVKPGPLVDAAWDDLYDEMVRGWHGFLLQLRHYLERHDGETRRTLWLDGKASPAAVLSVLDTELPGTVWTDSRHQRVTATDQHGNGLVAVLAAEPLSSDTPGTVQVTITTHGLTEEQFAETRQHWVERWASLAPEGTVTP